MNAEQARRAAAEIFRECGLHIDPQPWSEEDQALLEIAHASEGGEGVDGQQEDEGDAMLRRNAPTALHTLALALDKVRGSGVTRP